MVDCVGCGTRMTPERAGQTMQQEIARQILAPKSNVVLGGYRTYEEGGSWQARWYTHARLENLESC